MSPQKKLMSELEVYNRKLWSLYSSVDKNTYPSHEEWKEIKVSLEKVRDLVSLEAASTDRVLLRSLNSWLRDAETFESTSEKYTMRAKSHTNQAVLANVVGNSNGNIGLVVEDYSLGLNTRQDRINFVEKLTKYRAAENRIFSRGVYTTPGGYPRNYPAAYIYNNGSFGNTTTLGRRDTLTPLYNNARQPVRRTTTPRVQIRIK